VAAVGFEVLAAGFERAGKMEADDGATLALT
jgi:hypothetical protein